MKKSEINITVSLDAQNVPEKIHWIATDGPSNKPMEAKALGLALWDPVQQNTLRIDLWNKDMNVLEMKRFYVETLDGMADGVLNATGDEVMAKHMQDLCKVLVKHIEDTTKF